MQKPYKDQLERMLKDYVEPCFRSPHGHLRAKACWVSGTYADIQFEGGAGKGGTFQLLMQHVIQSLQDPELPVSLSSSLFANSGVNMPEDGPVGFLEQSLG